MKQILLKSLVFLSILLASCNPDDDVVLGEYQNGVFVINEGNFGDGDGSISFFNKVSSAVEQTIFDNVNKAPLGDVVQSATFHNGLLFIVVNNSNRVEVVNAYTFESVYSMTDVALPRYVTISGNKGYLTEWVSFTEAGRVAIFDLATGAIESRITVGFGAENILIENNKAYVSNSFANSISIIDLSDNSVENVTVTTSPKGMELDKNGDLWLACAGGFNANDGALHKIDLSNNEIKTTINLNANYAAKIVMDDSRSNIHFFVDNNVFKQDISTDAISSEPWIVNEDAESFRGIGIDPSTGMIYLADSKLFLKDGEVYQYDKAGKLISTFPAGRGPNGFVFN